MKLKERFEGMKSNDVASPDSSPTKKSVRKMQSLHMIQSLVEEDGRD